MAGPEGVEPSPPRLERGILPLNYGPELHSVRLPDSNQANCHTYMGIACEIGPLASRTECKRREGVEPSLPALQAGPLPFGYRR